MDDREKFMNDAKAWAEKYYKELMPFIKETCVFSPVNVARLCQEASSLTFYMTMFQIFEDCTEKEMQIEKDLQDIAKGMMALLKSMQPEFEEFEKNVNKLEEELNREPIDMEEELAGMETIFGEDENFLN